MTHPQHFLDVEGSVDRRYGEAANQREEALCCPIEYDPSRLAAIPTEVLERDYGCGDPSRYVRSGDTVLDLGSGGGKICFIASQIAGPTGRVIGIDRNEEMLALARRAAPAVAEKVGFANVAFHRARIQDLRLDLDSIDSWLREHPVRTASDWSALEARAASLSVEQPLIGDRSIDIVISNCVLNLVRPEDKSRLVREIHRVLAVGGRVAISDIVSDAEVPESLQSDPELWSGCVSGAFQEQALIREFEAAGFYGISIDQWSHEPFRVVAGIEFRSVTVSAYKGDSASCGEEDRAVIYRGPWKSVEDDAGHVLRRGERTPVCSATYHKLASPPLRQPRRGTADTKRDRAGTGSIGLLLLIP